MNSTEYLEKMKSIQNNVLEYIDDGDDSEAKFQNVKDVITKNKIEGNIDEFKTFLYFLKKYLIITIVPLTFSIKLIEFLNI